MTNNKEGPCGNFREALLFAPMSACADMAGKEDYFKFGLK